MIVINFLMVVLGGLLVFMFRKNTSSTGVQNQQVISKVEEVQAKIDVNNANIQNEEDKRKEIDKEANDEKAKSTNDSNISDFFNNRKS